MFLQHKSIFTYDWSWEEEQKNVEKDFNVIETGEIFLNGKQRHYNLILFIDDNPPMISFYVTVIDTANKRQYTLSLVIEYSEDYKTRICNLKPLLESFKMII
ncbi:MAG: hypothetical protein ACI8ZO_000227 [Flavobacteriales bacterium]